MKPPSSTTIWLLATSTTAAKLQWKTCTELPFDASNALYQCANLTVPLDYQDNSSKPLTLNLLKFLAPEQPSRGSILFNPGGPGSGGRNGLYGFGQYFAAITGNKHDIISWDPRGTGVTIPVSCYANASDDIPPDPFPLNASDASISAAWKNSGGLASACKAALAGAGEMLGTAYVARDMERIVDALGEDGMLRYFGASYGSVLGQVFAGIFPDKVDKMVIDGIVNLQQLVEGRDIQTLASTDAVWQGFLSSCLSRPSLCPLAKRDTSVKNLRQQLDDLFDRLQVQPISLGSHQLTASLLETTIFNLLYMPSQWPALALGLDLLLSPITNETASTLGKLLTSSSGSISEGPFPDLSRAETTQAIRCSDTFFRTNNVNEVAPFVKSLFAETKRFPTEQANDLTLTCPQWPFAAKERFNGTQKNFDAPLKSPMLVVSNLYDPVTPLDSALNTTALWNSSVLLVQQGYGHTSLREYSKCKSDAVAAYFNEGKLPHPETVCLVDTPTFATAEEIAVAAAQLYQNRDWQSTTPI